MKFVWSGGHVELDEKVHSPLHSTINESVNQRNNKHNKRFQIYFKRTEIVGDLYMICYNVTLHLVT